MKRHKMSPRQRMYIAAWLYHWWLQDTGQIEGQAFISDEACRAFPWKTMKGNNSNLGMIQGLARTLYIKISSRDHT
jgi:hypothetical protein